MIFMEYGSGYNGIYIYKLYIDMYISKYLYIPLYPQS